MRDRADMPIPARVRNRFMITLPVTTLCCLMMGGASSRAEAQVSTNPPVAIDPQPPATTAPPVAPPATADTATPATAQPPTPDTAAPATLKSQTSLLVLVKATDTGEVVGRAAVRLDSETEVGKSRGTDAGGGAIFNRLDDGVYAVVVTAVGYRTTRLDNINVVAGVAAKLVVFVSPLGPTDINVNRSVDILDRSDYSISYTRNQRFIQDFPLNAGNRQDLSNVLLSVPGVAKESENQFYTRGEGTVAMSTTLDGTLVPPMAAGSLASVYDPEALQSVRAIVGNFAPEYTGSGMVLNLTSRPVPLKPSLSATGRVGSYNTTEDYFNLGSSFYPKPFGKAKAASGRAASPTAKNGQPKPRFGYVIGLSQRFTDSSVESPQPDKQTVSNRGETDLAFGKFNFQFKNQTSMNAIINYSSAKTNIADRTGLPSDYAAYGQGYGFAGASPAGALGSQEDDGKSDQQKDNNLLTILQFNRQLENGTKVALSATANRSTLEIISNSPTTDTVNLPTNSSIEYKPYVRNDYSNVQIQGDITLPKNGFHQYKVGGIYQTLDGQEAYQLSAQSQVALDILHAVDPRLTPSGGVLSGVDALGFPTYSFAGGTATSPTPVIVVHRTGYYGGAYAQDTWRVREALTVNYGVRLDTYNQTVKDARFNTENGIENDPGAVPSLSASSISPRINGVLSFPQTGKLKFLSKQPTLARFGYNRLFAAPGMSQGAFIGNQALEGAGGNQNATPPQPEITDQYDISIERQVNTHAIARIGYFSKSISHYLETEQLIPGLQADTLSVFNQGDVQSDGADITFELLPLRANGVGKEGLHAFFSFEDSQTHPTNSRDFNNLGYPTGAAFPYTTGPNSYLGLLAPFVEGDQTDTFSFGLSSKAASGIALGLSGYYGSGLYSSAPRFYSLPSRANSQRQGYSEINVFVSTGPRLFKKHAAAKLEVANLANSQERIDYLGSFDGTRFQQGRRVFLSLTGGF